MTEQNPPEHSGTMDPDPTGMHPTGERTRGPLVELGGDLGEAARMLVAALNPHPTTLPTVEAIVADIASRIGDPESVIALRYVVETAIARASAMPMMPPRGDQRGERVTGRSEPPL